jgi:hypothetical protein
MARAYFRFYAELNDFLPPGRRQVCFAHCIKERASIKDAIESLGVPHPEVDLILVRDLRKNKVPAILEYLGSADLPAPTESRNNMAHPIHG